MEVDKQPGGAGFIDVQQLSHRRPLEQRQQVVARDELEDPRPLQPQQNGQRQVVPPLGLIQPGCALQQGLALPASRPYPGNSITLVRPL